ncbi:MAG: ATP-NAD kinase family protein [Candidatus Promineifilaceae bacterium]|jgi:predicted polyphosphate/ATP-dependent NAD kinase
MKKPGLIKLGLIVNPAAGLGGAVGLKGSDGPAIQAEARALGARPKAQARTREALQELLPLRETLELVTYPGEMGEDIARECGFAPLVIGSIQAGQTTGTDTQEAARAMSELSVSLILFAGGDGTARDIYEAVGPSTAVPVLGIPAGVKIHSAVYATHPRSAGELARLLLEGRISRFREAEVVDIDEAALRQGVVSANLYGYLKIPFHRRLVQNMKSGSPTGEQTALHAIAQQVIDQMQPGRMLILGPGTTTRAISDRLGLTKTLIGVDVLLDRELIAADANEQQLLALLDHHPAQIVITPIGGQGYLFGRGNQQISPAVIRRTGIENILVISTPQKIVTLGGRPFLVDSGDTAVDQLLAGYIRVITGYNEQVIYKVNFLALQHFS